MAVELFGDRPVEDPYRPLVTTDTEPDHAA